MRGRSVVYTLALDRPIDMIPLICPWARRVIQTISRRTMAPQMIQGSQVARALVVLWTNLSDLMFC